MHRPNRPLDEHGAAPKAYARGGKMSDFEKSIFEDFWSIANDKDKAAEKKAAPKPKAAAAEA